MKKKIIFSDLMGTIVPASSYNLNYLYGKSDNNAFMLEEYSDEEFAKMLNRAVDVVKNYFNPFLQNGNYLYIVSDLDRHDMPDIISKMFLFPIYKRLNIYEERVQLYILCSNEDRLKRLFMMPELTYSYGKTAIFNNGLKIHIIQSKDEVFKYVPNINSYDIYAIGDNARDLPMLKKCMELGGTAGYIYKGLYGDPWAFNTDYMDSVIKRYVRNHHYLELDDIFVQKGCNESFLVRRKYQEEIYKKIRSGEINFNDLVKNNVLYDILLDQYCFPFSNPDTVDVTPISDLVLVSTLLEFLQKQSLCFEEGTSRTLEKTF